MPYSSKANYKHYRQLSPDKFDPNSFKTVPLSHTRYSGKKFKKWKKSGSGAKAIVGVMKGKKKISKRTGKKVGKRRIQSILIPKNKVKIKNNK